MIIDEIPIIIGTICQLKIKYNHMKTIVFTSLFALIMMFAHAQDTTKIGNLVKVNEDASKTEVTLLNNRIHIEDNYGGDTTHIRVGKRRLEIVEKNGNTNVSVHKDYSWTNDRENKRHKKFNGHWAAFELCFNGLYNTDYSLYDGDDFMDLDQPKSLGVNINFLEYNVALRNDRIGLVTGMGWTMNNYRFDNEITIKREDGIIVPVDIEPDGFEKSKLTVSYLTVPLLLEFQIPVNGSSNQLFVSGGVIGGINIGSHTKVKNDHSKSKDHGSFNINPFQYALTGRVGLKDINLFATYSLSPLFKDGKGPEMFPFSIGISLVNL